MHYYFCAVALKEQEMSKLIICSWVTKWLCYIVLQVKPEIKQFKTSAANHTACQDDVISFNCSADANPLVTSYQLFENGTAILDTDNSGMWSRNMSTRGVFIYKCMASNTYGTGNSEKIAVHVYGKWLCFVFFLFITRINISKAHV